MRRMWKCSPPRAWMNGVCERCCTAAFCSPLPLDRASGESADELALEDEEEDDDRDRAEQRGRRERAPLVLVLPADEERQADGERVLVGALQEIAREDEVRVRPDEAQQPEDDEDRADQRQQ